MKKEIIPDEDDLYRRIHHLQYDRKRNKISAAVFQVKRNEKALSVNWSKYSTPEETSIDPVHKGKFYVGGILAKIPRQHELDVVHAPGKRFKNRAHSTIVGRKLLEEETKYEISTILADNCRPIITKI